MFLIADSGLNQISSLLDLAPRCGWYGPLPREDAKNASNERDLLRCVTFAMWHWASICVRPAHCARSASRVNAARNRLLSPARTGRPLLGMQSAGQLRAAATPYR